MDHLDENSPLLQNNEINPRNFDNVRKQIIGAILSVLCSFGFSMSNYFVKKNNIDFVDFLFVRSLQQIIIFGVYLQWKRQPFFPKRRDYDSLSSYIKISMLLICQVRRFSCVPCTMFPKHGS